MRALVVFESMFGNTEKIAGAVARGLQQEGVDTGLVEVRSAPRHLPADLDLLVVGGPTHAFGRAGSPRARTPCAKARPASARPPGSASGWRPSSSTRNAFRGSRPSTPG